MGLYKSHENFVSQGKCLVEIAIMLLLHIGFEVVAGNNEVGIEEDVKGVVDRCPSSQNLWVVFVGLSVDLVDIATNGYSKHTQILQVVPQRLGGGNRGNGGKVHDDFLHEWGVFDAIEDVLIFVGKQLHFRC